MMIALWLYIGAISLIFVYAFIEWRSHKRWNRRLDAEWQKHEQWRRNIWRG
jgi:hypothetical protein